MGQTFTLAELETPSTDSKKTFTLKELEEFDKEPDFSEPKQLGYLESIAESFMRGERSWQTDMLGYEASKKGRQFYNSNVRPEEDKFYDDMSKKRLAPGGWIKQAGLSLSEMTPGLAHGAASGVVGASIAGLGTAAVGALLPIPEEIYTIPAVTAAGFTVNSAREWYKQGTGNLYNTMAREDVPDEIAQPTSHIAGVLYSAIEFTQFHKYIPGGKEASKKLILSTVQNSIKNVVKKYGTDWAENVFEEGLQEIVTESAKEYAMAVSNKSNTATGDKVLNVLNKGWQAMKSSALPMLLLFAPAMGKVALDAATDGKAKAVPVTETAPAPTDEPTPTHTEPAIVEPGANVGEVSPTEVDKTAPENFETAEEYVLSKGSPLLHATSAKFESFDVSKTVDGAIWVTPNKDLAEVFRRGAAKAKGDANIIEAYGDLKNPLIINKLTADKDAVILKAKEDGHDGIIIKNKDGKVSSMAFFNNDAIKTKSQLTAEWESAQAKKKSATPSPKMVEKEFVEEYEEAPESLDKEYARAHRERTEQGKISDTAKKGYKVKRGNELKKTMEHFSEAPTKKDINAEKKKLNTMTVGKTVETTKGTGVITKNPSFGYIGVKVNGVNEAFLQENVAPIKTTDEQAIASLKAKAEKSMTKYLKDIGREYKPTSIKRTRVVKRMVPAEQAAPKPADVVDVAPPMVERTDDQIRAEALSSYLGSTEDSAGMQIVNDEGEVLGKMRSSRPVWWSSLGISMERTTSVLDKYSKGETLTEAEQRDLNAIMEAGKSEAQSMINDDEVSRIKRAERLMASGATQEEARSMADMEAEQDLMDAAGIVDDEAWIADIPVEEAPALDVPAGEKKVSKAAADTAKAMVEAGFDALPESLQAQYSTISKKKMLDALVVAMEDYERSKRIAFGEEAADLAQAIIIYRAVEKRATAEGDQDTLVRLSKSTVPTMLSKAAQAMAASGFNKNNTDFSAVEAIRDIDNIRATEVSKKTNVAKETNTEVKKIKDMTKKELRNMSWDVFIKSIEC